MITELIYSKITKISGSKKGASIGIHDKFLNGFENKDVLVEIHLIKRKFDKLMGK